jgi:hypothetical protein
MVELALSRFMLEEITDRIIAWMAGCADNPIVTSSSPTTATDIKIPRDPQQFFLQIAIGPGIIGWCPDLICNSYNFATGNREKK